MRRHWLLALVVILGVVGFDLAQRSASLRGARVAAQQAMADAAPGARLTSRLATLFAVPFAPTVTPVTPIERAAAALGVTGQRGPVQVAAALSETQEKEDKEEKLGPDGHPRLIGADHPAEAAEFRRLSLLSEDGEIVEGGLMAAAQQARELRGAPPQPDETAGAGINRGAWTWLGPGNIGGRIRALLVHPATPATMFVGGVDGGIWKTTNSGASWAPVDDFMANLAVSTMAFTPGNSSVMYAGTGEGFYNADGIRGAGIFKSVDGGTSWAQLPSTANSSFYFVNRIAISPDGTTILAATRSGVFRSTNGGSTWTAIPSVFEPTDVNFHPTDSSRAVVSGYDGDAAYSTNGGASFTAATGLPGSFSRVEIAYAPSSPNIVYASVDASGGQIYVSTDGGITYTLRFNGTPDYLGGQGWYDNALWVNPQDPNFIIVGGIDLYKSLNGGTTLLRISSWSAAPASAHADHHVIVEHPAFNNSTNRTVFFGNDGGIYRGTDVSTLGGGGAADCPGACTAGWTALNNNLGVTQFYGGSGHAGSGVVIGGTQDNGSLKYTPAGGVNGWTTTFGGDGGWSAIDPNNANNLYGEYVRLALHRSLNGGGASDWINGLYWNGSAYVCKPAPYRIGDPGVDGCDPLSYATGANFIAPFILDPNNSNRLLAGGNRLFRTNDASTPNTSTTGPAWFAIKPSIGSAISAIAVAKLNSDVVWVGHNNGNVYSTANGLAASPAWTQRDLGSPVLPNRMVTRITVDPSDSNIVYVAFGGFNADNLWRTMDGGVTWTAVTGSGGAALPSAPIRDLEVNPANSNWLYAATEVGLFASETGGLTWTSPHDGPANVSVDELFMMGGDLVAVTHGRGMFRQSIGPGGTTGTITGTVTNATGGAPLPGVSVSLYSSNGTPVTTVSPDSSGIYAFTGVTPGTYRLRTSNALGFVDEVYNNIPCLDSCDILSGSLVNALAGVVTPNINFALAAGGRITGTVRNASNSAPLSGITVTIYNASGVAVQSVNTNGSGVYLTTVALLAGNHFVRTAGTVGFADEIYNNFACTPFCAVTSGTAVPVTAGATTSGINFDLSPAASISGVVTNAANGQPLSGVAVSIVNAAGFSRPASTNSTGHFVSPGLAFGTYYARTSNSLGFVDERYNNQPCIGGSCTATAGTPIPVSSLPVTNIDFALQPGGSIQGTVRDQNSSTPLANVFVDVVDAAGSTVTTLLTPASGEYGTPPMPPGTYWVRTRNTLGLGYVDEVFDNLPCAGCAASSVGTPVNVSAGGVASGIDFGLQNNGGSIAGAVTSVGGGGIAGVTVQIYNAAGALVVSTNSTGPAGTYLVPTGLPAGTYYARTVNTQGLVNELYNDLDCFLSCAPTDGQPISVSAGVTTGNVNFTLRHGGRVSGRVTNSFGVPLSKVAISIASLTGVTLLTTTTEWDGTYVTTTGLPPGGYWVRTTNNLGYVDEVFNNVPCPGCSGTTPGAAVILNTGLITANINFVLDQGGRISGRVTDGGGAGLEGVTAVVYSPARVQVASALTDASGNYQVETGLPAGSYYVRSFNRLQYIDEVFNNVPCLACDVVGGTPVNVSPGAVRPGVDFQLTPGGGGISGTVTNSATGLPVAGVTVSIYTSTNGLVQSVTTDASGAYATTTGLTAGNYFARTSNSLALVNEVYNNVDCVSCNANTGTPIAVTLGIMTTGINFALAPGAQVGGLVTSSGTGTPMPGVSVAIFNAAGASTASATTGANGRYLVTTGLPSGSYYARTTNGGAFVYEDQLYLDIPCLAGCTPLNGTPIALTAPALNSNVNFSLLTATPRLTLSSATVPAGTPVTVTLRNGLGGALDWMVLAAVGSPDTSYLTNPQYIYVGPGVVNRTWTFNAPAPGMYEARLFQNDGFTRLATSPTMTVLPGLSINDVSLDEGQGGTTNAVFTVTLSAASSSVVTVNYATADGTATAGSDYTGSSGALNFSPGVLARTISVPIAGDTDFEPNETFTITLSGASNAVISDASGLGTIRGDDSGPTLAIDDVSVVEGDSGTVNAVFTVTLSPAPPGNASVSVNYATADGTATAGSDYAAAGGALVFAPGEQVKTITVLVNGDTAAEGNETYFVDLTGSTPNAVIGDARGNGTIINDEGPRLTLTQSTAASGSPVTVNLTNGLGGATDWITLARVGNADTAYVTWTYVGAGMTSRAWTVTMPPAPGQYEFRLYPNNTFNRIATSAPISVLPGMTINDVAIAEGNSGTANLTFTVTLSAASPQPVSVQYATSNVTAAAGSDYTATSGTLNIAAGQVSGAITVPISGDTTFEPTETLQVALSSAVNAIITDAQGVGTITNDDLGPTLTINDVSVAEGDAGTVNAVFTVTLNPVPLDVVTVDYATAPLSANASSDYVPTGGTLTFPGNVSSRTITVAVNGDMLLEPNETFAVNLTNASTNAAIGDAQGIGTIVNDEGPRLTPNVTTVAAAEPLTLTLTNTPGGATDWVALALVGAPDTSFVTYVYVGAGVTSRTWTLTMPPAPGTYEFRLFANNTYTRLATSAPVTVQPGLRINDVARVEGNSGSANLVFTITLAAPSAQPISVQYFTTDGTATASSDYTPLNGSASFAAGVTSQQVSIGILGDTTFEPNETFTVNLASPANAIIADGVGVGTIQNDDAGPTLNIDDVSLVEGNSGTTNMTFTVTLAPTSASTVTVDYATANQTATAGSDYTATSGTLTFNAGESSKTFTVAILGDFANELHETFRVTLSNANAAAAIGDGIGVGTITNDDGPRITPSVSTAPAGSPVTFTINGSPGNAQDWIALSPVGAPLTTYSTYTYVGAGVTNRTWTVNMPASPLGAWEARLLANNEFVLIAASAPVNVVPGLSVNDVSRVEGHNGSSNMVFAITLSAPSPQPVTVQYFTSDGTATAGVDYTPLNGSASFAAGVVTQQVSVQIAGDTTFEPNETFNLTLSSPTNAVLADAAGVGTIQNDDAGPTLNINDVSLVEGDAGSTNMTFTVTLAPTAGSTVTVDYATSNQTATAGSDYTASSGTLTFNAGESSKTLTVPILGDFANELHETFRVTLSNANAAAAIGDGIGVGTITNDDGPRVTPSVSTAPAGSPVTFTINGSPGNAQDWIALAPVGAPLTTYSGYTYIGAGVTSRTWTVNMPASPLGPWEARLMANNEFVLIASSAPVNVVPGLGVNDVSRLEGNSGTSNLVFNITLSAPSPQPVTVQYMTSDGTATAGVDYTPLNGSASFAAGVTTQQVTVPILGDTTFEPNETFNLTLSSPTNAVLADGAGVGTIQNDDAGPTLNIDDVSLVEGNSGTTNMTFTVTLTPTAASTVTVDYATSNQTATAGSDYTASSGTLTFNAGESSKTLTVPIIGDFANEIHETFRVTLSNANAAAAIGDGIGVGTITNDDGPRVTPSVSTAPAGSPVTFTINGSPGNAQDWIALAPVGAPLTTYSGYTYVGPGVTSRTWTVNMPASPLGPWEARLMANNEFVLIATSAPVNVVAGLSVSDASRVEGNSGSANLVFNITLSAPSPLPVSVQYFTSAGTATAGSDFTAINGSANFPAGVTSQPVSIAILGDTVFEPNETFTVNLTGPTNAIIADGVGVGTIQNDDAGPTLNINDVALVEGDAGSSNMTFTVTLTPTAASTVTVDYATSNQTATAGSDYTASAGTLTFNAGESSKTLTVPILGDFANEIHETFRVTLSNANAAAAIGDGIGVGTITNDDGPRVTPSVSTAPAGSPVTFTINGSPGNAQDWIALSPVGAPLTTYSAYTYVGPGVTSRTWTVNMPASPLGQWEARLLANNEYVLLATSAPVTVVPGLSVNDVSRLEGNSGTSNLVFNITLSAPSPLPVTVQYAMSDGTATAGLDYTPLNGSASFPAGVTTQPVSVAILGDTTFEPNETFSITLFSPANAVLADATGIGTIQNDDAGPTFSIADASVTESDNGSVDMTFNVTLSPAPQSTVTVDYATANQSAMSGVDYIATSGTLSFAINESSKTVTVPVLGDMTREPGETFLVNLSNVGGAAQIGDGQAVGTVLDNDGARLTVGVTSATSGNPVQVSLTNGPGNAQDWIALALATAPLNSYVGYVYVPAGSMTHTWTPLMPPQPGTYEFRLFENNGYTLLARSAAITVIPSVTIQGNVAVAEGNSGTTNLVFNVVLSAASSQVVTVDYASANDTATAGVDYTAVSGTLTFPAGTVTRTITVPVNGDTDIESTETFTVALSNPVNAGLIGGTSQRTGTITNDDVAGPCADSDGDRLCNVFETNTGVFVSATNTGTNPNVADTDGDAITDGDEVLGTLGGLNLPGMGANPLKKNVLFEYDWINDSHFESSIGEPSCGSHSHRPTAAMIARVSAAFAAAPVNNPDGTTGITLIHDYGQGGVFTGGNLFAHSPNITGGVNGTDFNSVKGANFATNRHGYFHYVIMPHWYTDGLGSGGQAELPGDDMIVSLGCYNSTNNVADTIMHEAGHNFFIGHGGFEHCNWKPNYNSVMNYRYSYGGIDSNASCNAIGDGILDYSRGTRISLNENSLNENAGVCGATPIDWNNSGTFTSGLAFELNKDDFGNTVNGGCTAALTNLHDFNDWANLSFTGIADGDGNSLLGLWMYYAKEVVTETLDVGRASAGRVVPQQQ